MNRLRRLAVGALCAITVALPLLGAGAAPASAHTVRTALTPRGLTDGYTELTLENGWTNAPYGTYDAAVTNISEPSTVIVRFRGAIATTGTNPVPFTLPVGYRPDTDVYLKVDMCNATNGRLHIQPSGVVTVEAEGGKFSNAACFTSLDGASFAMSSSSFTPLTLQNGWTNAPFGTSDAEVSNFDVYGIIFFKGAISTSGSNPVPFTLPPAFRPPANVFVPVDLCNATNGRLEIKPSGVVTVQAEGGQFSNAACFTSLDGVSFALGKNFYWQSETLENGWANAPYGTSNAASIGYDAGFLAFEGAISTGGTNQVAFSLPAFGQAPAAKVFIPVDLCHATNGRLEIDPNGEVIVEAEGGKFANAQCFTSLEGAGYIFF
jgi:hypothetical protein